jgi:two-component system response regulator HydG
MLEGPLDVVVIDDDRDACEILEVALTQDGMNTRSFANGTVALREIESEPPHVLLTDLEMEGTGGLEVVRWMGDAHPDVPVIVVTGHADLDHAVNALRAGAYDFLTKPLDHQRLAPAVRRAGEHGLLRTEVKRLRQQVVRRETEWSIVGDSPPMKRVFEIVERVARIDAPVFVTGESGTGKELIARALHQRSARAHGPFVAVSCAAVPANLIETELFGHARGAFTGAGSPRSGLFSAANGGTLFLDEIGELPVEIQPKLLRALQERCVRPVGADHEVPFDARLISATNRVLEDDVATGRFREDLFYRLNVVTVQLPPLNQRGQDILALAQRFVERTSDAYGKRVRGIGPDTARKLLSYPWPGNVRELENCVSRAVALTRYDQLTVHDLPERIANHRPDAVGPDIGSEVMISLSELEERYIRQVLDHTQGNKAQAARVLGIDRRTLYRKLVRTERVEP